MKKMVLLIGILVAIGANAQEGIQFEHSSWGEIKAKAIKEKKMIFVDFYTQWCGPCLAMAEDVFVLESVGNFYNANFINAKVDAENGEGVELAKHYGVRSYPTFLFIDPSTDVAVHQSGSRQDKETFLFTGHSALNPQKRSNYFDEQMKLGNKDPEFLLDYACYAASRYNRNEVDKIAAILAKTSGYSLENEKIWKFFCNSISGRENAYFKELLKNSKAIAEKYGQQQVDSKLFKEFNYCPDLSEFDGAPDFQGKQFLKQKNAADKLVKEKKLEEAAVAIDNLMANPGSFKDELCIFLSFTSRSVWYGEYPASWVKRCISYAQYAAYNYSNRNDVRFHYEYALLLERLVRSIPDGAKYAPESVIKATDRDYSLRSPLLKNKPVRK